ncbi:hypothetical protein ES705_26569 [subsurface metagenome]
MSNETQKEEWPWKDAYGDYSMVPVPQHEKGSFTVTDPRVYHKYFNN